MSILDPAIRLVGRLSFRHKMHATALAFGAPLVVALGVILAGLGARVSAVQHERDALAVQVPALTLLVNVHRYLAVSQAWREGAEQLAERVTSEHQGVQRALNALESALAERQLLAGQAGGAAWLGAWKARFAQVAASDADGLSELHSELRTSLRGELDRLNEGAGLLVDGQTSTSRLIDIMTAQLPELIDNTGQAARLGAVVLVNQRMKSSRRTELTLLRGNFNALVQWSMEGLQKVGRDYPELAASLDDASSRLNTAYLGVQEAMTTKMLDTTDFDLTPDAYLDLTAAALDQSLAVGAILLKDADQLLGAREAQLQAQRNGVLLAMVLILALVIAGFVAAYTSIMRGLNDLSAAVNTMASGDLSARVEISTSDEIGSVGTQFNLMVESLAQRTALLREKTNDIQNMLHHMPQGILTIVAGGAIHPEYSDYLETIFETKEIKGKEAIDFIFGNGSIGADALSQVAATTFACIGEDRMNFDFNAHLLADEVAKTMADGRIKYLELCWSPICGDDDRVDKIMVCVRDVSELRLLEAEAEQQKRELQMIGQILSVSQEKFGAFVDSARGFLAQNAALLDAAADAPPELVAQLFRNMHTIKGNARTYGLLQLTDTVHQAEQAYADLRQNARFDKAKLLGQLHDVRLAIDEYATLSEAKLGRQGPGRRGNAEKYVMVPRDEVEQMVGALAAIDLRSAPPAELGAALERVRNELRQLGSESIATVLAGVFESLPSLAKELGKEAPKLLVSDQGIRLKSQIGDLLRNVFMHLYRNCLDHGIEEIAARFEKGKHPAGTIRLDLALLGDRLQMRLYDDGQGLALGRIRRQAIDRGLIASDERVSDEQLAKLIFAAGFSTASVVTEVSGRGVGMDAVQNFVRREDGEIHIEFTDNYGGADCRSFATVICLPARYALPAPPEAGRTDGPKTAPSERGEHLALTDLRAIVAAVASPGKLAAV